MIGYLNIINANSSKALDDMNDSSELGTQMQQWTIIGVGNGNQQWQLAPLASGDYAITNRASKLALDLTDGALADGTAIQGWQTTPGNINQSWELARIAQ